MPTKEPRSLHSIRIHERLVDICNKTGLPLNNIVESCLVKFTTLNDEERIQFLVNNDPDKVDFSSLKDPEFNYADRAINEAKQQLGNKSLGRMSVKALIAIGLFILAGIFLAAKKERK